MNIDLVISIDVGVTGSIACYDIHNQQGYVYRMPSDIVTFLKSKTYGFTRPLFFIENVSQRPQDLKEKGKIFRVQKMVKQRSEIIGIVKGLGFERVDVMPTTWLRATAGLKKDEEYKHRKARVARYMKKGLREGFMKFRDGYTGVTQENADAIAMLVYGISEVRYNANELIKKIK